MRYWVYHNSRILGPYDPSAMAGLTGLNSETLVCSEDALGRRDTDWQRAGDVPELVAVSATVSVLDDPLHGANYGYMDRIQLETSGAITDGDAMGHWLDEFIQGVRTSAAPIKGYSTSPEDHTLARNNAAADLAATQKISELSIELRTLQQRIKELEAQQDAMLDQLTARPSPISSLSQPVPLVIAQQEQAINLPVPAPVLISAPPMPPMVLPPLQSEPPLPPPALEVEVPAMLTARPEVPVSVSISEPPMPPMVLPPLQSEPPLPPSALEVLATITTRAEAPTAKKGIVFTMGALKSVKSLGQFQVVKKAGEAPRQPTVTELPTQPEQEQQPAQLVREAKAASMPDVLIGTEPLTAVQAVAPRPIAVPSAVDLTLGKNIPSTSSTGVSDVVARLAKPTSSAKTSQPHSQRKNGRNKIFLAASTGLVVVSAILFILFFRSKKDVSQMVSMDAERAPIGTEQTEETTPRPIGRIPQSPASVPAAPVTVTPPLAAPDPTALAISLVKGYPLDGDRGSVGQWLQYSFAANPGDGHKEDWTAGGIAESTYLVEYKATFPSGSHEPISYLFEADTTRKTLLGRNPAAKQLLAGSPPKKIAVPAGKAKKRTPAKHAAKSRRKLSRPITRQVAPPSMDILPLPSDAELHPAVKDDAGATADTSVLNL